jgi:diguanylate cyclase (GGDEF)-like protein
MSDSTQLFRDSFRALVDQSGEGACLVDPDGWRVAYANPSLLRQVGVESGSVAEASLFAWLPDLQLPAAQEELARLVTGELAEATLLSRVGSTVAAAELRVRRVATADGMFLAFVVKIGHENKPGSFSTERHGVDPLTGLADRAFILEKLTKMIRGDRCGDQCCSVLFIDVDGFKQVNDAYGHLVGDRVLCEVARRLASCVRAVDHVARFGGDEFVMLLEHFGGRGEIDSVVRRILAAFERPIPLPQGEVTLSVSLGAARAGEDGHSAEALIDAADRAMYAAKRATA